MNVYSFAAFEWCVIPSAITVQNMMHYGTSKHVFILTEAYTKEACFCHAAAIRYDNSANMSVKVVNREIEKERLKNAGH